MYPGPWPIDIGKWPGSLLPLYPLPDGSIPIKWGWDRVGITGTLQIEGRRLDAPAPPLRAHVPPGYGDTGFQVSTLIFPTEGCWEVTGRVGSHTLTFVVLVLRLRPFPERGRDPCPICSDPSGGLLADLSGALRLVLGGVLLRAFVAKARVPRRFIEAVRAYALLPPGIAPIAAGGLLLAEPVLALALLTGWGGALAWDATVLLLGLFLIAVAVNLRRGRQIPCGCLGPPARRSPTTPWPAWSCWRLRLSSPVCSTPHIPIFPSRGRAPPRPWQPFCWLEGCGSWSCRAGSDCSDVPSRLRSAES
jgi:hypothetical protein